MCNDDYYESQAEFGVFGEPADSFDPDWEDEVKDEH